MTQRHTRRSADEWQAIVDQYTDSGLAISDFCQQRGYALATFSKWKRRLTTPAPPDRANKSFVRVATTPAAAPPEHSSVTLQIGRQITLNIHVGGVDGGL